MLKPGGLYIFVEHVAAKGIEPNFLIHWCDTVIYKINYGIIYCS